jgi:PST family polysaccharide transporter
MLWSGGFTLLRDIMQFGAMLALTRLLSASDYGNFALAQSIVGLLSIASFGTFVVHALQSRDPESIDWQAHFTAAVVINGGLFLAALAAAGETSLFEHYRSAALPLAGMAATFPIEIAATLRFRMLETRHEWSRFRTLAFLGTAGGLSLGVVLALLGAGVWALVIQVPLFGIPAAIDLFWGAKWRPDWSWSWDRYRDTFAFGGNRMAGQAVVRLRQAAERMLLAGVYSVAALGVFSRSVGLGTILAGRLGSVATAALFPVITRAPQGSAQYRRLAALVFQAVCWATVPAVAFLAVVAGDVTHLLYGSKWEGVVPLLPAAAAAVGIGGMSVSANTLLLANNAVRACLMLDVVDALSGLVLAMFLIPMGMGLYLAALALQCGTILALTLALLRAKNGISSAGIFAALVPSAMAGAVSTGALFLVHRSPILSAPLVVRLAIEFGLFSAIYLCTLRFAFSKITKELIVVAPGGKQIGRLLLYTARAPPATAIDGQR